MRTILAVLFLCGAAHAQLMQAIVGAQAPPPSGGGSISYVSAATGYAASGSTATASTALNVEANDQLWIFINWATSSYTTCASVQTVTFGWSGGSTTDTYTIQGTTIGDTANAQHCLAFYTVEAAAANSSETLTVTVGGTGAAAPIAFSVLQGRGTANATADQTGQNTGVDAATVKIPSSGTITTTNASAIVVAGAGSQYAKTWQVDTGNCFGTSATQPSAATSGHTSTAQYLVLSSTVSAQTCTLEVSASGGSLMGQLGVYH